VRSQGRSRHVLREAAEERLHKMNVRLHEARHHDAARDVDNLVVRGRRDLTDAADACSAYQQVAADRPRIAHWEERASAKQNAHG